ncbi:MAG: serine/threonine protein kinase [Bryobacterales bacterium]|nr:serine/threonine protein kinase [Bryobacterales bacterium]
MNLKPGDRVGDYEILGVLGAGGMGSVYKVRNIISDRVEAIKVLLPNLAEHQDLKDRFLREIKTSASLEHTNISALRTAFQSGDMLLMVMEFVEGETLDQRMKRGPLPMDESVRYTSQILDALEYAHSRGVVHRDIKPQNIMITPKGTAKLLDFGIAKAANDKQLTMTGTALGSLYYMSPEQIRGEHVDGRADLYSLGVTLYELVTGKRPFGGDSGFAIMAEHLQKQPVPPVELDSAVPPALNAVILRALAKNASDRFQSAAEFRAALRNIAFYSGASRASNEETLLQQSAAQPPKPSAPPAPPFAPASPSPQPHGAGFDAATAPAFAPQTPPSPPQPEWRADAVSASAAGRPKRRNTLALALIAVVAVVMLGAVAAVVIGTHYFRGSSTTMAAQKEPGLLDRITGLFGSKDQASATSTPTEDVPSGEAAAVSPHVDPASIDQAIQTIPSGTIDTGSAPVAGASITGVNPAAINAAGSVGAPPGSSSRSRTSLDARKIDEAAATLATRPVQQAAQAPQAVQPPAAVIPETPAKPKVDPRALAQARDAFAKLGIRAGVIQESARALEQEQARLGVSMRGDIRASLKRMEYLMDRTETALNNQDLESANTEMVGAEREIERLEKFFHL